MVTSLSSSPFKITVPSGFIDLNISVFAFSMPSLVLRFSRWHHPIFVITHTSGHAIAVSLVISPKSLIPISSTAISSLSSSVKTVSGRPISLLKLPCVFFTLYFCARTDAIVSFVLVFPTLPVIPTTLISSCCL